MYSPDTTKYLIHLQFQAEGVVEKPDVVGAIFGQTEGLLGEDLDLRDLQRTGRIGRIDVQLASRKGETTGEILISSSLDRAETAVLAASFETIDRVGPCVAQVRVSTIEDIRVTKRKKIVIRAKEILIDHFEEGTIDTYELLDQVRETMRIEKISAIGDEKIPAGPHVLASDAIIVVEGRADVINLLRVGIRNAVAAEGTNIPAAIIDLCSKKTATAFFDGDRGGDLILQELLQRAEIDYVAFAPREKSVEDMSRKEIVKALRNKIPVEYVREHFALVEKGLDADEAGGVREEALAPDEEPPEPRRETTAQPKGKVHHGRRAKEPEKPLTTLKDHLEAVRGLGVARFLSADLVIVKESPANGVDAAFDEVNGDVSGVIVDGGVNQRTVDRAVGKGLDYLAAREFGGIVKRPVSLRLLKIS